MMRLDEAMTRELLRSREEAERKTYRDEAQATAATKMVKITGLTGGLIEWIATNGETGIAQNSRGSHFAADTWILITQAGLTGGWQVEGIAPYVSG